MVPRQTLTAVLKLLQRCLENGDVRYGRHFKQELANEGLEIGDAWTVLRTGRVYEAPEPDIRTGEWKYRLEGREPGGALIVIVFALKRLDSAYLITIFSVYGRGTR